MAKSELGLGLGFITTVTTRVMAGIKGNEEAVLDLPEDTLKRLSDDFVQKLIAEATKSELLWKKVSSIAINVNLGYSPKPPFTGAVVEKHVGEGWAPLEKRADGLYVDGQKVVLHLSKRQRYINEKSLKGYELRDELTGQPVLNANILDALYKNLHLIPEDWKKDEKGSTLCIFFWGTIYRDPDTDNLCPRFLCFRDGSWHRDYHWLGQVWYDYLPAALLAS